MEQTLNQKGTQQISNKETITELALFDSLVREYEEGLDTFESIQQHLADLWIDEEGDSSEGATGIMNAKTVAELQSYAAALMYVIEEKQTVYVS